MPTLTFLFWNIRNKPILDRAARIAHRHAVDLVVLAECAADENVVLAELVREAGLGWNYPPCFPASPKVKVFTRLPPGSVTPLFDTVCQRLTIREVRPPVGQPLLMAAVHLVAKSGGWTDYSQSAVDRYLAEDLERIETTWMAGGSARTVLIGDLNMPPFAPGMVDGFVFHSFATRDLAARRTGRIVQGRQCRRAFFNPMWQFMTDRGGKPSGTYYWHESLPDNHYWYTLDQVLVRPELADKLVRVEIIDTDGIRPLTTANGWPDAENASDHLPIAATFEV